MIRLIIDATVSLITIGASVRQQRAHLYVGIEIAMVVLFEPRVKQVMVVAHVDSDKYQVTRWKIR